MTLITMKPARGTRDILGRESLLKAHLLEIFYKLSNQYGFSKIETPIFEQTGVFKRTLGETSDIVGKEMYTFEDKGNDLLTLRPEGTAPVARALISNGLTQTLPQRFCYDGPMFRYERPQKGRFRQFYHAGVEYIGSNSPLADVQMISFASRFLKELNIPVQLTLNTLGDTESRLGYRDALVAYFSLHKDKLSEDSKVRLTQNPLRILDSKDLNDQALFENAPLFEDYLTPDSKQFFDCVLKGLDDLGISYKLTQTLVRGLDYYSHTVFEFKTDALGAQDTVLAGGRYDKLISQMGGPDAPAIGWAMGIDRACLLMEDLVLPERFSVGVLPVSDFNEGLSLAETLRSKGVPVIFPLNGNLGKRFKNAQDCAYALIFGDDEVTQGVVKLKNLKDGTEEILSKEKAIDRLTTLI